MLVSGYTSKKRTMVASFSIPISETLVDQELEIVLTPDVETTIKQKYVCVTLIHKGI